MDYANPTYIPYIFLAALALMLFFIAVFRRRRALVERFADKNLLGEIAPSVSSTRRLVKALMLMAASSLLLLALARPQWGFQWQEVKRQGLDILIAIDVSKSMLAKDVKPNRLERSKFAVKDLIKKLNGDRVGIIAFAGTAFLQCPLTIDYNGFLLSLDDLSTQTIPRAGTSISQTIREALNIFKSGDQKYKILVIITDGEEHEGDAIKSAQLAKNAGIRIYCVGVGTEEGELIPLVNAEGERVWLADKSGNVVKTRLNEDLLKKIAILTGGGYIRATQAEFGLSLLYDKYISLLERRDIESKMRKQKEERFQIFLAAALALLLIETIIPERRRVLALLALFLLLFPHRLDASHYKEDVKYGNILYNKKKYDDAVKSYESALTKKGDSNLINYNLGNALYKKELYDNAVTKFNKAISDGSGELVQRSDFNIGNAQYRLGEACEVSDISKAKIFYETALDYYKRAIELNPKDKDAKFNYEFVSNRLKGLEERKEKKEEKKEEKEQKDNQQQQNQQQNQKQQQQNKQQEQQKQQQSQQDQKQQQDQKEQQEQQGDQKQQQGQQGDQMQEQQKQGQGKNEKQGSGKDQEKTKGQEQKEKPEEKGEDEKKEGKGKNQEKQDKDKDKNKEKESTAGPEGKDKDTKEEKPEQKSEKQKGANHDEGIEFYEGGQGEGGEAAELSEQEAKMLLEGYKGEEATGKTTRMRRKYLEVPEPQKDW